VVLRSFVRVIDNKKVQITLDENVPHSPEVDALLASFVADVDDAQVTFIVQPESLTRLDSLAQAFRNIVKPGRRYAVNNYKYVCPRTADSLIRLRRCLADFWFETDPATIDPILRQPRLNLDLR
jgi:hypothetical protein